MKRLFYFVFQRAARFRRLPAAGAIADRTMKLHRFLNRLASRMAQRAARYASLLFLVITVVMKPITGGVGPINGADIVLRLNDSSGIVEIAFQKDVSFDTTNATIDISSKTTGRRGVFLMGRLEEEVSLDMFWSDEQSYILLRNAARNGLTVTIVRAWDDDNDDVYENIEQADAIITKLGEKFPDQEGGMVNVSFKVSGNWGAVV